MGVAAYFANQREMLLAAAPIIDRASLLPADAPADAASRLALVIAGQVEILRTWEPQLRAALRLALDQEPATSREDRPVLRQGRAIGWIEEALQPLGDTHPDIDRHRLAIAIRAGCGIEAWVRMVDVAGVSREDAAAIMRQSSQALLAAAVAGPR